jgi:alkaline phosphatase D
MREAVLARIRADNPDIRHARADAHGYTLLDVTPARVEAVFRTTPHPVRAHSVLTEQARFVVLRGRPGVLPA